MHEKVVVALDLGTTGNRAIAFNKSGSIVASAYYEFTQYFPHPGWVEHDADEIWTTIQRALHDITSRVGAKNIATIGITNQRETTVIWDKTTGTPLHKAIVWQCRRTTERCKELKDKKNLIKQKTGLFLDPYFSATKIEWLIEHSPSVRSAVKNKTALFGTIDTWILYKLTQGKVHATDVSNASRTMLFNIETLSWDADLLALFNIPIDILPEVKSSDAEFGEIQLHDVVIPIRSMIGDQQAALFAQCGNDTTKLKNTYGTGLFLMANTGLQKRHTEKLVTTIAWKQNGQVSYALEGSIFTGGSIIQWIRDGLQLIKTAEESEALATSISSNDGVFFVPALTGLGAPYWEPEARGVLFGITRGTQKAHIIRAALESLTYQTKDIIEEIKLITDQPFEYLTVDGGAITNTFLMQTQSNMIQMPVAIPTISESTAFGAAAIAGIAIEFWTESDISSINQTKHTYTPTCQEKDIQQIYNQWKKAVKLTIEWGKN